MSTFISTITATDAAGNKSSQKIIFNILPPGVEVLSNNASTVSGYASALTAALTQDVPDAGTLVVVAKGPLSSLDISDSKGGTWVVDIGLFFNSYPSWLGLMRRTSGPSLLAGDTITAKTSNGGSHSHWGFQPIFLGGITDKGSLSQTLASGDATQTQFTVGPTSGASTGLLLVGGLATWVNGSTESDIDCPHIVTANESLSSLVPQPFLLGHVLAPSAAISATFTIGNPSAEGFGGFIQEYI